MAYYDSPGIIEAIGQPQAVDVERQQNALALQQAKEQAPLVQQANQLKQMQLGQAIQNFPQDQMIAQRQKKIDEIEQKAKVGSELLLQSTDQSSWDYAKKKYHEMFGPEKMSFDDVPFSEDVLKKVEERGRDIQQRTEVFKAQAGVEAARLRYGSGGIGQQKPQLRQTEDGWEWFYPPSAQLPVSNEMKSSMPKTAGMIKPQSTNGTPLVVPTGKKGKPSATGANMQARAENLMGAVSELGRTVGILSNMDIGVDQGVFGGVKNAGTFFSAPVSAAANILTDADSRKYNMASTGLAISLATIDGGGYKPQLGMIQAFEDKFKWKPGDSLSTKLFSLSDAVAQAEARAKVTLANPKIPKEQKDLTRETLEQVKRVIPFSPEDVTDMERKGLSVSQWIEKNSDKLSQKKVQKGTLDNPIPITTEEQVKNLGKGQHYSYGGAVYIRE